MATGTQPGATGSPTGGTTSVLTPQSQQDLMNQAQAQAAQETAAAESPYKSAIDLATKQMGQTQSAISSEFANLLPQVTQSANAVKTAQDQAVSAEQQVFTAAGQQLNQLAQNQAKTAQDMAQQIGGPVSTGEFTDALVPYMSAFPSEQAGGLLNALGLSQAGSQEAQAFAGQVFPAMQTEQQAQARNFYQDKISTAQDAINQLESQKSGLINDKYTTLLQNERQFELNLAQQKLDQTKANRDWAVAKRTLRDDETRLAIEQGNARTSAYNAQTSRYRAQVAAQHASNQDKLAAQRNQISLAHYMALKQHYVESDAIAARKANITQQKNAQALIDMATGTSKTAEVTVKQYLSYNDPQAKAARLNPQHPPKDVHIDPKTGRWYQYVTQHINTQTVNGGHPITDPNQLYRILIGGGISKSTAETYVRAKTGLGDWAPGKSVNYSANDLSTKSLDELAGIAKLRGFKGPAKTGKQGYMDYILAHNPASVQSSGTSAAGGG